MTRRLGEALRDAGRLDEAVVHLEEALRFFADHGDRYNQAQVLVGLGQVHDLAGRLRESNDVLTVALKIAHEIDAQHKLADIHSVLAGLSERMGDPDEKRRHLERAHDIYVRLGAPDAER
jgi:tetratricopeptide (TPR) repeat protein